MLPYLLNSCRITVCFDAIRLEELCIAFHFFLDLIIMLAGESM